MFGFDKKSGIFAFLSGMDQIDASLRGSLEKHEQKILPGFKGMKLE
jgi:hypothetical protein